MTSGKQATAANQKAGAADNMCQNSTAGMSRPRSYNSRHTGTQAAHIDLEVATRCSNALDSHDYSCHQLAHRQIVATQPHACALIFQYDAVIRTNKFCSADKL